MNGNSSGADADVIVIGSGPAGVSVCFPLVDAGRRVVMIDGARSERAPARHPLRWQRMLGPRLEALVPEDELSPKLRTPTARQLVSGFDQAGSIRGDGFSAIGARSRGGLSQIWGGFVCEFDERDLTGWPVTVNDLRPSYKTVTERVGVSGSATDDMAEFYGRSGVLLPPLPVGPTAGRLLARYRPGLLGPDFAIGLARNAILTVDHPGRLACNLGKDCLWGCGRGAVYDARFDLAVLEARRGFRLFDDFWVTRIAPIPGGWEVSSTDGRTLRGSRVAIAAGTLGTLPLALPLVPNAPSELRLLSSPVLAMPLLVPARLGQAAPDRGFSLAQLGYRLNYGESVSDYIAGAVYEVSFLPVSSLAARLPLGRRASTELMSALAPALLVATAYFPGDCSANRIQWQRHGDHVHTVVKGRYDERMPCRLQRVKHRLRSIWRRLGAWPLPGASLGTIGTDVHFGGPFAMGLAQPHGTTGFGELHAAPGIFVADAAAFPSVPPKYITLTIMANADRIGRHLAAL